MPRTIPNKPTGITYSLDESVVATIQLFLYNIGGINMEIVIISSAVFMLLWLIIKPFMLMIIEKENEKYKEEEK